MLPCQYFDEDEFNETNRNDDECLNVLSLNIRSLPKHGGELLYFLKSLKTKFDAIVLTEIGSKTSPLWRNWFLIIIFITYCLQKTNAVVWEFTHLIH